MRNDPWELYDRLVADIPEGIAVRELGSGGSWCFVDAECGMGIAHRVTYGAAGPMRADIRSLDLRSLAELSRSWNYEEASFALAAVNAWHTSAERLERLGADVAGARGADRASANPFSGLLDSVVGKKVAVIGHFPNVELLEGRCDLAVLERTCASELDTPDSACEYVLPHQDYVFVTGTTLINKTAPRLLDLSASAVTVMVGPTSPACGALFDFGCDVIAGSVVVDAPYAHVAVLEGDKRRWREGIRKFYWPRAR